VEIYGWINIKFPYSNTEDAGEEQLTTFIPLIKKKVETINGSQKNMSIRVVNGNVLFICNAILNHESQEFSEIIEICKFISTRTKGSYGVVYIRNSEKDPNKFNIIRIAKGQMDEKEDYLLSPCIPTIED
jgi:hypothetical protein